MAKYIDAGKLKYEIEKRKLSNYYTDTDDYEAELFEIIEEQPEVNLEKPVPSDLEEAAKVYFENPENSWQVTDVFIAGAKWQKSQDDMYVDTIYQQGIEKGKDDMKEQMLKNAVEGEVYKFGEVAYVKERNNAELTKYLSQFNNGDKVKIIVIHETDIR